jgi:predicted regulator of Ras-like GTPase activity (Roadblock/LC7/MglB family)
MSPMRRRVGNLIERLTKVTVQQPAGDRTPPAPPAYEQPVRDELRALRHRLPGLTGSLVASADGLLVAADLPPGIEPSGLAALTTSGLALSHRIALTVQDGGFQEVVIRAAGGHVVTYAAGPAASLTVLAGPDANVGRLHLESRPAAARIAALMNAAESAAGSAAGSTEARPPPAMAPHPHRNRQ